MAIILINLYLFGILLLLPYLCRLKRISMATRLFDIEQIACMPAIDIESPQNSLMQLSGGGKIDLPAQQSLDKESLYDNPIVLNLQDISGVNQAPSREFHNSADGAAFASLFFFNSTNAN